VATRLRQLIRDFEAKELTLFDELGRRRVSLHYVLEGEPGASAALDALGEGAPMEIDRDRMLELHRRIPRETLNALAGLTRYGYPTGRLRPPWQAIMWLLYDACWQGDVGRRRVQLERDARMGFKTYALGLARAKALLVRARLIVEETERAYGRPDPIRPPPGLKPEFVGQFRDWLQVFAPESPLTWPSFIGSVSQRAGPETEGEVAKLAALGAFAVIMSALIRPPVHKLVGEVAGYALQAKPYDIRVVRHHCTAFLRARSLR
jgi:hypothetical protein